MDIETIARTIGVLGIAAIIFAETGLLVGFFLPGDTLLFAAGLLTAQGVLGINIHAFVLLLTVAAIIGNSAGYAFGARFGRKLFKKPNSAFFSQENLQRAEKFYEKYGALAVIIGRFTPFVRTFVPIAAGISKMTYATFTLYNVIGGFLWIASVTYIGYYGGNWLHERGINIEAIVMPVILAVLLISLASPLYHILANPQKRQAWLKLSKKSKSE